MDRQCCVPAPPRYAETVDETRRACRERYLKGGKKSLSPVDSLTQTFCVSGTAGIDSRSRVPVFAKPVSSEVSRLGAKLWRTAVSNDSGELNLSAPDCLPTRAPFDSRFQYLLKKREGKALSLFQQMTGIEPALSAWEAEVLPLNHICVSLYIIYHIDLFFNTYEKKIFVNPE